MIIFDLIIYYWTNYNKILFLAINIDHNGLSVTAMDLPVSGYISIDPLNTFLWEKLHDLWT